MLKRFSVTNYRGFSEKLIWDLSASNYNYNSHVAKEGIVKSAILFGENGTGKSNLGLAVFDIFNHLSDGHGLSDYYDNFIYAGNPYGVVEFEYLFHFLDKDVLYRYTKDREGVLQSESLSYIVENQESMAFAWDSQNTQLTISDEFRYDKEREAEIFQRNRSLSIAKILYTAYSLKEDHYLVQLKSFVDNMLWFRTLEDRDFIGIEPKRKIHEYLIQNGLVQEFQQFLKEVSGQEFDFSATTDNDEFIYCQIGNTRTELIKIQSTGTSSLTLLFFWLHKIKTSSFIFIDEFDAFYHLHLAYNVCQRLFNNYDGQIVFSSHDTSLMTNDLLRADSYYIINGKTITSIANSTDKDLRKEHNLERMYRAKAFE